MGFNRAALICSPEGIHVTMSPRMLSQELCLVQCGDFVTRVENAAATLVGAPDSAIVAAAESGSPPTAQ